VLPLPHEIDDLLERLIFRHHAIGEVRTVEARDEQVGFVQLQVRDDVVAHALGRRRGQRHHRHFGQCGAQFCELPILRPEIMTPLRHAMRLIDREAAHVPFLQILAPAIEHQPFGRGVEQLELPAMQSTQPRPRFVLVQRRIEKRRRDSARLHRVDLIFH
jgi:hypothetical protein